MGEEIVSNDIPDENRPLSSYTAFEVYDEYFDKLKTIYADGYTTEDMYHKFFVRCKDNDGNVFICVFATIGHQYNVIGTRVESN
jgi:hypothetical protein